MAGFGVLQSRFNRTTADYFLAHRSLPWVVVMFSIVATETSVLTFISVPGLAYRGSWFFLQLALGYIIGRVIVSLYLLPQYYRQGVTSIYEVLGARFGKGVQKTASLVFLVTRVLADGVRFLATAVIIQVITGWSLSASVLIIGLVTLIYTLTGGIKTVVWLDSFQFILYLSGAVISILFILSHSQSTLTMMFSELADAGKTTVFIFNRHFFTDPWSFFSALTGGILLSLGSHGVDYMMVQRALGCRDLRSAQKAMIGSGFFVFLQFALFLAVGSLIYLFFQGAELTKDREFSTFIVQSLPVGLKGILLAGVLSAAMSTLSSSINSLASSTVTDWFSQKVSVKTARLFSLMWAGILIGIALFFNEGDSAIIVVGLKIASFTYGGLIGLFILSKTRRKFKPLSLNLGLVSSLASVFILQAAGIAWTLYIGVAILINLGVTYLTDYVLSWLSGKSAR